MTCLAAFSLSAFRADPEKFQFMVEILESGFFADFIFQLVNWAGGLNRLDAAAGGADKIIAVAAGKQQGEICGSLVKAEAAD